MSEFKKIYLKNKDFPLFQRLFTDVAWPLFLKTNRNGPPSLDKVNPPFFLLRTVIEFATNHMGFKTVFGEGGPISKLSGLLSQTYFMPGIYTTKHIRASEHLADID